MLKEIKIRKYNEDLWEVMEDYKYKDIIIPKGFLTDGASVPKIFQWIYPKVGGAYTTSSVIHDYRYKYKMGKVKADIELFINCLIDGVDFITSLIFLLSVLIFGGVHYYNII